MDLSPCIGDAANSEFLAYGLLRKELPDLKAIAEGRGKHINFPDEPSLKFAVISELTFWAIKEWDMFQNALKWFIEKCDDEREMTSMFVLDVLRILQRNDKKKNMEYMQKLMKVTEAREFIAKYVEMTTGKAA